MHGLCRILYLRSEHQPSAGAAVWIIKSTRVLCTVGKVRLKSVEEFSANGVAQLPAVTGGGPAHRAPPGTSEASTPHFRTPHFPPPPGGNLYHLKSF